MLLNRRSTSFIFTHGYHNILTGTATCNKMREVNFSIPNANKASVGITTALYDRRALDCTSTLPLINSLNHLAYLTTSSARIRDILTVDGGVERLVCILKAGRSRDGMDMWKWNLAFQCVVNIGVRGSENVRTRVVEADMVPVIATILDNYIKLVDKRREKNDNDLKRNAQRGSTGKDSSRTREQRGSSFCNRTERGNSNPEHRQFRRQAPPPSIEIPVPFVPTPAETVPMDTTPTGPQFAVTSPPERTTFPRRHHHHHRSHDNRHPLQSLTPGATRPNSTQPLAPGVPSMDVADGFGLRPVRDIDRLPSMVPGFHTGITSQPESPTTPNPLAQARTPASRPSSNPLAQSRRRPSIRHQRSMSGESDDANVDTLPSDDANAHDAAAEPIVDIRPGVDIQGIDGSDSMLDAVETPLALAGATGSEAPDVGAFNITHRSAVDGTIIHTTTAGTDATLAFSPAQPAVNVVAPAMPSTNHPRYLLDRQTVNGVVVSTPHDEDVLMSLQLLAYVSKYCNLRTYFQKSHLVPKLKVGSDANGQDDDVSSASSSVHEDLEEEYLVPNDLNIFPLVEKYTVRHHSPCMQYWAGVVMRNLCRKDDSRGGIRQCAYYECGKWEKYTRQFAKCRRCRRTKYCSKECQKSAWVYHRHWCVAAQQ
ncbi:MAG: hypothetical protein M1825_005388 [Sarcosagium campestre]|nr:MAG: hypothetical protein M1825_005388 [Sarcosagium campestre]